MTGAYGVSPYGYSPYGNLPGMGHRPNFAGSAPNLGAASFGPDGQLGYVQGDDKFDASKIPVASQSQALQAQKATPQSFQGKPAEQKSGIDTLTGTLAMGGAAGAGWHGVQKFYNPDLTKDGKKLLDLATDAKAAHMAAGIEKSKALLTLLEEIEKSPDNLSDKAKALQAQIEKKGLTADGLKTRVQNAMSQNELNLKVLTGKIKLEDGKIPESVTKTFGDNAQKAIDKAKKLAILPDADKIADNKPLVDKLTTLAKTKMGKIGAGAAALLSLAWMVFKD